MINNRTPDYHFYHALGSSSLGLTTPLAAEARLFDWNGNKLVFFLSASSMAPYFGLTGEQLTFWVSVACFTDVSVSDCK